jgi:hypothetical protein
LHADERDARRRGGGRRKPIERELRVLRRFAEVYCRAHHAAEGEALCQECRDLVAYARRRLERCPYDPKPKCKDCPTHCYKAAYRERVRAVMRYAGPYFVKRGRLDWLIRYLVR